MHLERESNITITALAEKNVETILLHEIIMNNLIYIYIYIHFRETEIAVK